MKRNLTLWLATFFLLAGLLTGCNAAEEARSELIKVERPTIPNADPQRGWQAIQDYGCGTCHTIPGVPSANATVGPPLTDWADRQFIAGSLANTPNNLVEWIRFPQSIEPGTAMPDMDVSEPVAKDIAAYLYTLKRGESGQWFTNFWSALAGE